jgi:hypothetical protein
VHPSVGAAEAPVAPAPADRAVGAVGAPVPCPALPCVELEEGGRIGFIPAQTWMDWGRWIGLFPIGDQWLGFGGSSGFGGATEESNKGRARERARGGAKELGATRESKRARREGDAGRRAQGEGGGGIWICSPSLEHVPFLPSAAGVISTCLDTRVDVVS